MLPHPPHYPHPYPEQHHRNSASSSSGGNSAGQTSSSGRMALMASTVGGAGYAFNSGDDKDNGNGFEVRPDRDLVDRRD